MCIKLKAPLLSPPAPTVLTIMGIYDVI